MATYKNINGFPIQYLESDPTNPIEGQVWFNSTSKSLKGHGILGAVSTGTWSSGGSLNSTKGSGSGSAGINTAGLAVSTRATNTCELYNGSSWTEVADRSTPTEFSGTFGSQTSAISATGQFPSGDIANVESWNGTSWSEIADVNQARIAMGKATSIAGNSLGLLFGGGPGGKNETESWNGSAWTELNNLNTGRRYLSGFGLSTSALGFGGETATAGSVNLVESWNGTSWTEVAEVNTGRQGGSAAGDSNTLGIYFGGGNNLLTEAWNGTAWTEVNDLASSKNEGSGSGSSVNAFVIVGGSGTATEEWTVPVNTVTFTVS
mgnify:FL=1